MGAPLHFKDLLIAAMGSLCPRRNGLPVPLAYRRNGIVVVVVSSAMGCSTLWLIAAMGCLTLWLTAAMGCLPDPLVRAAPRGRRQLHSAGTGRRRNMQRNIHPARSACRW